jgi:lysophospholipase L1-like esterase
MKHIFYFVILLLILFSVLEITGYVSMGLVSRKEGDSVPFSEREYFKIRKILMNQTTPADFFSCMPQPVLNYIPTPLKEEYGFRQHNYMGFRGHAVSLQKPEGIYRILFLGGSTTYGSGVNNPDSTFPALTGIILNTWLDSIHSIKKYNNVEVINGGLEGGTSAEELTHYLFKYRYFKPDLIVLHSGINDALKSADNLYQPDYGNFFLNGDFNIIPLPIKARFILRSYFLSFIVINLVYYDVLNSPNSYRKTCMWYYPQAVDTTKTVWQKGLGAYTTDLEKDTSIYRNILHPAFEKNIETLIRTVLADSFQILILTNAINPTWEYQYPFSKHFAKIYTHITEENKTILVKLATLYKIELIPFEYSSVHPENWLDNCHLNEKGEREKATIVANFVKSKFLTKTRESK